MNVCPLLKGTSPSPNGLGYARIPGVFSPEQTESWKVVTDAVHSEGGRIFLQLMHAGRCGVAGAVDGGHERHGLDRQPGGAALWLVSDIFAFTLALFMIFWFAGIFPAKLEALEKKTRDLMEKTKALDSKNIHLNERNRSLSAKMESLSQANQNLLAQVESLQENNRNLDDAQNKVLGEGNLALNTKIVRLDEANALLRDIGRKDWEELLKEYGGPLRSLRLSISGHIETRNGRSSSCCRDDYLQVGFWPL